MTDKQIIDYKNLCENYNKEVGCYGTFDGSCIKEQCFTYKLLQQLQAKEQECEELKKLVKKQKDILIHKTILADKLSKTLTEIKEIAEKIANYYDGDEYELMRKDAEQILQKISECEVGNV